MGYGLHITRKPFWADEAGPAILLEEWLGLVEADPELELTGAAEVSLRDGGRLGVADPSMAVWLDWSGNEPPGGNMAWLWWFEGNVDAKNPDAEFIGKMVRIAQSLGAEVQGDDGETYDEDGSMILRPAPVQASRPWWKFW